MTQPPPGIRTAPPKGGPLGQVNNPSDPHYRQLLNSAFNAVQDSRSVPSGVKQELLMRGLIQTRSEDPITHFLAADTNYDFGPSAPKGLKDAATRLTQLVKGGETDVVPKPPLAAAAGAIQAATGTASNATFGGRLYNSAIALPQQALPGLVDTITHPGQAAKGLLQTVEHPLKSFSQNPVGTAALALAPAEALSRGAGGLLRTGALGENLQGIASMERTPIRIIPATRTPTGGIKPPVELRQTYSPSILQKGGQVLAEHVLGNMPSRIDKAMIGGGGLGGGGTLRRPGLVHAHAAMSEMMRRRAGQLAVQEAHDLPKRFNVPKGAEHAIPLAVEGTLRTPATLSEDLGKRLDMLKAESANLKGPDLRINQRGQRQVQSLIDHAGLHANPQPIFDAAKAWTAWHAPLEQMLAQIGHIEPGQLNAKYVPYAISHMGAKYDPVQDRLTVGGKPLTGDQIQAHMKAAGIDRQPGFLTHRDQNTFSTAIRSRQSSRPGGGYQMRTGVNYRRGTYEMRYPALGLQGYRSANLISAHQNYNRMLNRFSVGFGRGAQDARRQLAQFTHNPEGAQLRDQLQGLGPVRAVPIGNARVRAKGVVTPRDTTQVLQSLGLEPHWENPTNPELATHALIPSKVHDTINKHDSLAAHKFESGLQWYTNKWRQAQLYTSPRWLLGNPQEHMIRLAFANTNPLGVFGAGSHVKIGRMAEQEFQRVASDPNAPPEARDVANQHLTDLQAGTHYGNMAMNQIRVDMQRAFDQSGPMGRLARFGDWLQNDSFAAKPTSKTLNGWTRWKNFVGKGMSTVEHNSKLAAYGKQAHTELRGFTGEWSGLLTRQDELVKQWAQGKLDPNDAAHLGNEVMRMMGNWSKLTPGVRHAVQTYSPFGLWWLNSLKFVTDVLPRDHPFKTAGIAAMEQATTAQRAAQGQGYDPQTGQPLGPAYLQGSPAANLPLVGKVGIGSEYYSPFGIGITPLQTMSDMALPQLIDPAMTLRGIDPLTGQQLQNKAKQAPSDPAKIARALTAGVTGAIPGARQAIALANRGGKPDVASPSPFAIEPGSQKGLLPTLFKTLLPLKTTAIKNKTSSGGSYNPGASSSGYNPGVSSGSYRP